MMGEEKSLLTRIGDAVEAAKDKAGRKWAPRW